MAKKPESKLQKNIRSRLEEEVGGVWYKIHGGPFQHSGIPDLLGCVEGLFFGLEVKVPNKGKLSELQEIEINSIQSAGGCAAVVTSSQEAINVVLKALAKTKRKKD